MQNQLKIKGVNPEEIPEDKIPQRAGITSNTLRLVSRAQGEKNGKLNAYRLPFLSCLITDRINP
jgi:hypothetical protein